MNENEKIISIVKKHLRYFKKPVEGPIRISFTLFEDDKDFKLLFEWLKKVEKERGWRL